MVRDRERAAAKVTATVVRANRDQGTRIAEPETRTRDSRDNRVPPKPAPVPASRDSSAKANSDKVNSSSRDKVRAKANSRTGRAAHPLHTKRTDRHGFRLTV